MDRITVDCSRKTTGFGVKTAVFRRITGRCYKSLRLNGTKKCRNCLCANSLELVRYAWELKCNPGKDLRLNSADGSKPCFHKSLSNNNLGYGGENSPEVNVIQGITKPTREKKVESARTCCRPTPSGYGRAPRSRSRTGAASGPCTVVSGWSSPTASSRFRRSASRSSASMSSSTSSSRP